MQINPRALLFAVLAVLSAAGCGDPRTALPDRIPDGATSNGSPTQDAGPDVVGDGGTIDWLDGGPDGSAETDAGLADAGPCPDGYAPGEGGCVGPFALWLSARAFAQSANTVYAGFGPQPSFRVQVEDPALSVTAGKPILLRVASMGSTLTFERALTPTLAGRTDAGGPGYELAVDTRSLPEGLYTVLAMLAFDGGVTSSNALELVVDRTPPKLSVSLEGYPAGAAPLIRDFIGQADLNASDDRAGVASLTLQGAGPSLSFSGGTAKSGVGLAQWPVELTSGDTLGLHGRSEVHGADMPCDTGGDQAASVTLIATASDRAGNETQTSLAVSLTRLKWRSTQVPGSQDGIVLGREGRLYGATSSLVWGLDPSGVVAWSEPARFGQVRGAPLVRWYGDDLVDFSEVRLVQRSLSRIQELPGNPASSTTVFPSFDVEDGIFSAPTYSTDNSWLLVGSGDFCGLFPFDGKGGRALGHVVTGLEGSGCQTAQVGVSGSIAAVAGFDGNGIYQWDTSGYSLLGNAGVGPWLTAGVAIYESSIWFAAGSELVGYDDSTSPPTAIGTYSGAQVSAPVIDHLGQVYVASSDGVLAKLAADGTLLWTLALGGNEVPGSPAVGADGVIYVVDAAGALDAVDPEGYLRWAAGPAFADRHGSPMIDPCNHTLYVTSASGDGVEAVVVDSEGLDLFNGDEAPHVPDTTHHSWPVYRHDYSGSGDARADVRIDCAKHL